MNAVSIRRWVCQRVGRAGAAIVAALALLLAGCEQSHPAFDKITIGDELANVDLPGAKRTQLGLFLEDARNDDRISSIRVIQDDAGRVVGKRLAYYSGANLGLFSCGSIRLVLEVEVPQECFHAPPEGWSEPNLSKRTAFRMLAGMLNSFNKPSPSFGFAKAKSMLRDGTDVLLAVEPNAIDLSTEEICRELRDANVSRTGFITRSSE